MIGWWDKQIIVFDDIFERFFKCTEVLYSVLTLFLKYAFT